MVDTNLIFLNIYPVSIYITLDESNYVSHDQS